MSCKKCYLQMSLTTKQWIDLVNCIAKSNTLEQVKLHISTKEKVCNKISYNHQYMRQLFTLTYYIYIDYHFNVIWS